MDTEIRKRIENVSPNKVINILLVLFGAILVMRTISYYSDYQEDIIAVKNRIDAIIDNAAAKSAKEIFEFVTDPIRISELEHWLAKKFFDLKQQHDITTKIILPPPVGIPTEKWSELHNTHKRVLYWIDNNQDKLEIPKHLLTAFISRMKTLEDHTHQNYDEHGEFGHLHGDTNEEISKSNYALPIKEYQNILNDLDSSLWLMEDKVNLDRIYRIKTRTGTNEINTKDLTTIYHREQGSIIEHYVKILRSKVEKAQYCNNCHGYEEGSPVLIHFQMDRDKKIAPITQKLKKNILEDVAWFFGVVLLGMVGIFFLKKSVKELQESRNEIEESEERFHQLFENETDAIMVFDAETLQFEEINKAALELFGYTKEEFLALKLEDISAEKEETRKDLQKVNKEGGKSIKVPLRYLIKKDGTTFPVEISPGTFVSQGRKKIIGAMRDITERKRADIAREKFSKNLVVYQESERKRISSEIHDGLGQNILLIKSGLRKCLKSLSGEGKVADTLNQISLITQQSIDEVREIISNLHPHQLEQLGLKGAIESAITQAARSSDIKFLSNIQDIDGLLPKDIEIHVYRIVQEGISNVVKHSGATKSEIYIEETDNFMKIKIKDNGKGFIFNSDNIYDKGFGLAGISERVKMLEGNFKVDSLNGQGTVLTIKILLIEKLLEKRENN